MNFEIIIDCAFLELVKDTRLSPIHNKFVLSILNDFEDGKWRFEKFHNFVWDNIAETALSASERDALGSHPSSKLTLAAKNLRLTDSLKDVGRGSELAEILLYGIMRYKYDALPVVPKIFYKQNSQQYAKGADSVHIVIDAAGDFSLWFGEAKFYNSIDDARLPKILDSIKESLKTDKLKKENAIITSLTEIDHLVEDESLRNRIKDALSNKKSIDSIKSKICIPILLLHECEITNSACQLDKTYLDAVLEYHKNRVESFFSKQIKKLNGIHKYDEIRFHLILFPVPQKESIVNLFLSRATSLRS